MEAQNRDVLLREMQHRVKNSFQIILASIAIQKRRYSTEDAFRRWIMSPTASTQYSSAHDQLAPREEGHRSSSSFPIIFVRSVFLIVKQQAEGIDFDVQADQLELSIDRAVPLFLLNL